MLGRLAHFSWLLLKTARHPGALRVRLILEALGPIFVKFGQALSTRRDFLSQEMADELAKLQDQVPPFSSKLAKTMIETSLHQPIDTLFAAFNLTPLASASIAQVHQATLYTGDKVVVKILRPNIHRRVKQDIKLLKTVAKLAETFFKDAKRFRLKAVVLEFEKILIDELDLMREAANASQLRRNFNHSSLLYVPIIYWDFCRHNVMVSEEIHGIPISDINALKAHGIDLKVLAQKGVEIFFTQVFRDCFFHADMHPGNIFVSKTNPENPKYLGVDFGIMGTLTPTDQKYLADNFIAFFNRDYRKVAQLHITSGWVPPNTRLDEFESAIRTVCEPIFQRPLSEISFGRTLLKLFQTARRFDMHIQPQLILLQKTLFNIEGLGRQLYPELDLWNTAKPFLEKWAQEQVGPKAFLEKLKAKLPQWIDKVFAVLNE